MGEDVIRVTVESWVDWVVVYLVVGFFVAVVRASDLARLAARGEPLRWLRVFGFVAVVVMTAVCWGVFALEGLWCAVRWVWHGDRIVRVDCSVDSSAFVSRLREASEQVKKRKGGA